MASRHMCFPGFRKKAVTFSYDDGVDQDIKLISIFDKYNLKATFNISAGLFAQEGHVYEKGDVHRRMTLERSKELYEKSGHEVACHSYTHAHLAELTPDRIGYEVIEDRKGLENIFGGVIRGMAYAYGSFDSKVIEVLRNCGIAYSRTTKSTRSFNIPKQWLELNPTCHHKDPDLMKLADSFINMECNRDPKLFYIWGHSYQFEEDDNWDVIEKFAERISGNESIWYATNIEIYDYVQAYNRLVFSIDMDTVYNPTATELFFEYDEKRFSVKPGETAILKK